MIRSFLHKYKWWLLIACAFLAVRILIFSTFWYASQDQGGWQNFYVGKAQPAHAVLLANFHDLCDEHPPLYYFFTSLIIYFFGSHLFIYFFHLILAVLSLFLAYKIIRLYFSEKIALISAALLAIEPYSAWHNFLLVSENLFIPLFLASLYFLFKFLESGRKKDIIVSGILMALSALTRVTSLLLPFYLSVLLILIFAFKNKLKISDNLPKLDARQLCVSLLIFNAVFILFLSPWVIRNKIIYDRFIVDNLSRSNFYFYNLPPLVAIQKNISLQEAAEIFIRKADEELRPASGNLNCEASNIPEFNRQRDYYQKEAKKFIMANFFPYLKMHLIKTLPFFLESGYFDMYSAYSGEYSKPDIVSSFLKGDLKEVKKFFSEINLKLVIYLFGIGLWAINSLAVLLGFIYACSKDKKTFVFMIIAIALIVYGALIGSPFTVARYRLPFYPFFFASFAYVFTILYSWIKLRFVKYDDILG